MRQWLARYALVLCALFMPLYLIRFTLGVPTTALEIAILIALIVMFDTARIKKVYTDRDHIITIGALLIVCGGVVGLRVSDHLIQSAGLLKGYLITPLIAGFLVALGGKSGKKLIERGAITAGFLVSLSALWQWFTHATLPDGRVVGIYGLDSGASPNYIALFVAPLAILAFGVALSATRSKRERQVACIGAVAMSASVFASQSRGGIAVILGALLWFAWIRLRMHARFKKRVDVAFAGVAVICIAIAVYIGLPRLLASPQSGRISSSNNIRYEIWKTTVKKVIPASPLTGVGFGEFQSVFTDMTRGQVNYPEYISPWALTPHNLILALWVDTGLLGVIGFILVCIGAFRRIPYSNIWFAVFASILALGLVDTPVLKNDLGAFFWMIVGGSTVWFEKRR